MYKPNHKKGIFYFLTTVLVLYVITPTQTIAQTGPGGVGSITTNSLWLVADDVSQANGTPVASWLDRSGNTNNASQGNATYRPSYITSAINGHSVVRFDGVDDYFDDARTYNARTIFSVYNISSVSQATTDLGQIWGSYSEGWHVALDARSGGGTWSFDGAPALGSGNTGRLGLNGGAFGGFGGVLATPTWTYNQFDLAKVEFNATRTLTRQVIGSLVPNFAVGVHQYGGDIAELVVYNSTLNLAQHIIVENYLAAKYNLTILNDYFAYEATHSHEVAGIGRETAAATHTSAMSANILQVSNPSGLNADQEYLIFGHDNTDVTTSWTTTEAPNGGATVQRLAREWRFSEQNGDVGTVTLTIDVNSFPALPAGFTKYGIMIDADGNFSTGAVVYEVGLVAGTLYDVPNINIAHGDYIAIVAIDPAVEFTLTNSDDFEPVNASIQVRLNYIPRTAVTVDYTTADGTASSAQPDYTAAAGSTATINAGSSTTTITIPITDDAVVEPDENFTVTLSNPIAGVDLGTNTVHTYTIHDDDDARKIYFDLATNSGDESVSPVTVDVSISSASATDVSVDYTVTGGTATGGIGNDYVLASGTLTITGGLGLTSGSFTFTVNDDAIYEYDETIIIRLSNPQGCNLDNPPPTNIGTGFIQHTYTIIDNDTPPEIQFSVTSGSGDESISPVSITVELNTTTEADAIATYTVADVSAVNGSDYTMSSGTVTITAGSLTTNLIAIINEDGIEELAESFTITLSAPTDATLGTNTVFTYTIIDNDEFGYLGPGGVGEDTNNQLWLNGDEEAFSDAGVTPAVNGIEVRQWNDQSGNGHNATQSVGAARPFYRVNQVNGHNTVRFQGNDYFSDAHSYSARTVFVVYQMLSAYQNTGQLGQFWGSYGEGVQVGPDARSGGGRWSFDGNASTTARFGINGAAYTGFAANPTTPQWSYNVFQVVKVEFDATKPVTTQDIGSLINPSPHFLGADIAELVVYNTTLNSAQTLIVENYLAAKYGLTITEDIYAHQASYGHEVAGIGREDANNFHLDAQGSSIARINNPSSMGDNDYMIWGHDNVNLSSGALTIPWSGLPAGLNNALHRIWRVDETGDMGTVTVMFDVSSLTIGNTADLVLLVDRDDGDFVNADVIPLSSYSAPYATFNLVDFNDGDWFTLGSATPANPLPVELLNFDAELIQDEVYIDWTTASEINNDFFTIEKSRDGVSFEKVALVKGAGNTSSIQEYASIDESPFEGISYYRLKQTDFDGNYEFSKPVSVKYIKENQINIFPNPLDGNTLYLSMNATKEQEVSIVLYNPLGQMVFSKIFIQQEGSTITTIDLPEKFAPGAYLIVGSSKSELFRRKLIIK